MRLLMMLLIVALTAVLACLPAAGQEKPDRPLIHAKELLAKLDTNGDGYASKDEFTGSDSIFDLADKNDDGKLDLSELANRKLAEMRYDPGERLKARFAEADSNGDGALDKDEFVASQLRVFKKLDKNADGLLTLDEMKAAAEARVKQRPGRAAMLKRVDANGDGRISKEEWRGPEQAFRRLDRNGDGFIDKREIPRGQMGPRPRAGQRGQAGPGRPGAGAGPREMLKRMDSDRDGRASRGEWIGRPGMFDRLDRNGDGYIDRYDRGTR